MICLDLVERIGSERHRPGHVVELDVAALDAEQPELQRADHAAQTRIAGQDLHEPLCLRQHAHLRRELVGRIEQQTVLGKQGTALQILDGTEEILLLRQPRNQRAGGLLHQLRRRRVDRPR